MAYILAKSMLAEAACDGVHDAAGAGANNRAFTLPACGKGAMFLRGTRPLASSHGTGATDGRNFSKSAVSAFGLTMA
jgi:hypothetical protein